MILHEALIAGVGKLIQSGIISARLDARLLLAHTLHCDVSYIVLNPHVTLSIEQINEFQQLIDRRFLKEPIAKILGQKEFWSLPFKVTQDTLDPRPETEIILEALLKYRPDKNFPYTVLDLGTGSGCLLLSTLHEYLKAKGIGVDIIPLALKVAEENARNLNLHERSEFILSDWGLGLKGEFDIIVSNPPYIMKADIARLDDDVKNYEPHLALDGGDDGLECYRVLGGKVKKLLKPDGIAILEIGQNQHNDVEKIFTSEGFKVLEWCQDLSGILRTGVFSIKEK
ncbi:peptide chain release factor N(5)-glutamine methyltransferase [Candidatus Nucleicultrix amoebiphila]|jgi:release factor glutamine methyltransferase|uniref:Release factor glutamine methyltransferase n=1 Tax=Candidatus Nucleicultrix amoebiphila FS5 TaxID=1414854 RepID=A0A1W6N5Y7_9PROT|nr:peptide chain release factor N(5)-glutamine methyltransferase [Candidatus Nucleicultrix amoebiphila]ARN85287.1 hypothetical protein GQ61_08295 [Candidatus Nucleicultrix amoebiphila FS5]